MINRVAASRRECCRGNREPGKAPDNERRKDAEMPRECLMDSWETIAHTEKTPAGEWGRPPGGGCFNEHVHNMVDVGIRY